MSRNPIIDDPRLTAFALNELNVADRAVFERQLADSPEAAAEVAAIREMADELRTALQSEPALPRTDFVVPTRIAPSKTGAAGVGVSPDSFSPRHRWASRIAVAAAGVALLGTFSWVAWSGRSDHRQLTERQLVLNGQPSKLYLGAALVENRWDDSGVAVDALGDMDLAAPQSSNLTTHLYAIDEASSKRARGLQRDGYALPQLMPYSEERLKGMDSRDRLARFKERANQPDVEFDYRTYRAPLPTEEGEGLSRSEHWRFVKPRLKQLEDQVAEVKKLGEVELKQKLSLHLPERLHEEVSAEAYAAIHDNPFASPLAEPLSTFSIDVDTAAYSNMRRFLTQGSLPPVDSVRIEELVNYFSYDYAPPGADARNPKPETRKDEPADQPFAVHMEVAGCPWNADHRLVRVGLKGKEIAVDKRPVSNIVFLIDVSGSMQDANKLPLVKAGLRRLVEQFNENDRVGIVVYAGASGLVLDSTIASQKDVILSSIENLQAGGSTNGGEGIQLAYALARKHFIEKGTNRVILCTDGDFNVGITNQDDLTRLIEEESKSGVFLSVLGFGMGNLKDSTLEKLADKGNGNYAYIDTLREANKVFVEQMTGTLITIAKDVKIQIEFNPALVGAYRLIGYENRMLAAQDFHDDTKDAGEIGAGHTVTALYEIIPPSKLPAPPKEPTVEKLKYQPDVNSPAHLKGQGTESNEKTAALRSEIERTVSKINELKAQDAKLKSPNNELLTIKLRYKQPDADKSSLIEMPLTDDGRAFAKASTDFRFAASVASFGMILRHSPHRGNATLDAVAEIAQSSLGADKSGYRSEFVGLVRSAKALQK